MGVGIWFWIIIVGGIVVGGIAVGVSSFVPMFGAFGAAVASLPAAISVISAITVFLGLVASTLGGSTDLAEGLGLLLFLFAMIAVSGFVLGFLQNRKNKSKIDMNEHESNLDP